MSEAGIIVQLLAGMGGMYTLAQSFKLPRLYREWQAFQTWRQRSEGAAPHAGRSGHTSADRPVDPRPPAGPARRLPGAGAAMAHPPALTPTLAELLRLLPTARYRIPLGWSVTQEGRAVLSCGALVDDINHIGVTGQSDMGKDNAVRMILLALAALHNPSEVQMCILDGKGLDFADWKGKAHTWGVASDPEELKPLMEALTAERKRRRTILEAAGVKKWEQYRGGDLPLLVVYISELSLLADAAGNADLRRWLNSELAAGRAFGLRYIVATQNMSNHGTGWRSQIGLYLAAFQPDDSQDEPNTGMSTRQIAARGAVPPSQLPGPPLGKGVFTIVTGGMAATVRVPLIDEVELAARLGRMPGRERALPSPSLEAIVGLGEASAAPTAVSQDAGPDKPAVPEPPTPAEPPVDLPRLLKRLDDADAKHRQAEQRIDALITLALSNGVPPTTIARQIGGKYKTALDRVTELKGRLQLDQLRDADSDADTDDDGGTDGSLEPSASTIGPARPAMSA
ncbi:MAG TPA: FtsK/SpoIIIE domain-containing protein [Herpetosiphonaceae bacterium]